MLDLTPSLQYNVIAALSPLLAAGFHSFRLAVSHDLPWRRAICACITTCNTRCERCKAPARHLQRVTPDFTDIVRGQGAADADECVAATAVGDMDVVADAGAAGLPHGAAAHPPATALSDAHTSDSLSRVQPSESRIAFVKVH
eukprot:3450550-Prymnesium_polylepis.1